MEKKSLFTSNKESSIKNRISGENKKDIENALKEGNIIIINELSRQSTINQIPKESGRESKMNIVKSKLSKNRSNCILF